VYQPTQEEETRNQIGLDRQNKWAERRRMRKAMTPEKQAQLDKWIKDRQGSK